LWSKVILTRLPSVKPLKWVNWLSIFVMVCISALFFMLFVFQIDTANSKRLITIFPNGIELGTSGNVTVKSASFSVKGPYPKPLPEPYEEKSGHLKLFYHDSDLNPVPRASYRVEFKDGTMREGVLDDNGEALLEDIPPGQADVYFGYSPDEVILPKLEDYEVNDYSDEAIIEQLNEYITLSPDELKAYIDKQLEYTEEYIEIGRQKSKEMDNE
jgi:hypothetical protein